MSIQYDNPVKVKVWGKMACFTRPEMKVERVSYPCITPSAARGVLDSILCKPSQFWWVVREIDILNPIRRISLKRNEVNDKINPKLIKSTWQDEGKHKPYYADDTRSKNPNRTQRNTVALKDVCYVIKAHPLVRQENGTDAAKYRDIFRRRIDKGQCEKRPYLGCREFGAFFSSPSEKYSTINESGEIGRMLFDIDYSQENNKALFFEAELKNGTLKVPLKKYEEIRGVKVL